MNKSTTIIHLQISFLDQQKLHATAVRGEESSTGTVSLPLQWHSDIKNRLAQGLPDRKSAAYVLNSLLPAAVFKLINNSLSPGSELVICLELPANCELLWQVPWEALLRLLSPSPEHLHICRMPSEGRCWEPKQAMQQSVSALIVTGSGYSVSDGLLEIADSFKSLETEDTDTADGTRLRSCGNRKIKLQILAHASLYQLEAAIETSKPNIVQYIGDFDGLAAVLSDSTPVSADYLFYLCHDLVESAELLILSGSGSCHVGINLAVRGQPVLCIPENGDGTSQASYWNTLYSDYMESGSYTDLIASASAFCDSTDRPILILPHCEVNTTLADFYGVIDSQEATPEPTDTCKEAVDNMSENQEVRPDEIKHKSANRSDQTPAGSATLVVDTNTPGALVEVMGSSYQDYYISGITDNRGRLVINSIPEIIVKILVTYPQTDASMAVKEVKVRENSPTRINLRYYTARQRKIRWIIALIILILLMVGIYVAKQYL